MGSQKDKKKFITFIVVQLLIGLLLLLPIIIPAVALGSITSVITSFFNNSGQYGVKEEEVKVVKELISEYKSSKEYSKLFQEKIKPKADKKGIPYSKVLIPLLLANVIQNEDIDKYIDSIIDKAEFHRDDIILFVQTLKLDSLFNKQFTNYTDSHILAIFEKLGYLFDDDLPLSKEELEKLGADTLIYPLRKKAIVTSEFGPRDITVNGVKSKAYHRGIDLAYESAVHTCGISIYAAHEGTVYQVEKEDAVRKGYYVFIKNESNNIRTAYLHLQKPPKWNVGDQIKKGDLIGFIGTTGFSTGCHLHFQVGNMEEWKNPRNYYDFNNPKLP